MSDVMLIGVLRMPYELAMADEISRVQFHARAREAASEIERLQAENERLRGVLRDTGIEKAWMDGFEARRTRHR